MKSHLNENEFWQEVEHLFIVGLAAKKPSTETSETNATNANLVKWLVIVPTA